MATPQWELLKGTIQGLSDADIKQAVTALGGTYDATATSGKNRANLSSLAYQYSKRNAGAYGRLEASYDATREAIQTATGRSAPTSSANVPDFPTDANGAPAPDASAASTLPASTASTLPKVSDEKYAFLMERLAADFEARMKAAGAVSLSEVRELCKRAVAEMPATVIEVRRDGALVGKVEGRQHKQFATLLKATSTRQADGFFPSVWLSGPAGSGKTHAARTLSQAFGRGFEFNGALSMSHEVLGYQDAAGAYHATPFRRAYEGGLVYLFDECDGCADNSPLLALNAALANGVASFPDKQITRHTDTLIIAGANTFGLGATADYVGRAKIDAAFLDRFPIKINWEYDTDLEAAICGNPSWAREVQRARKAAKDNGLKVLITPRASIAGAALIEAGMSIEEAKTLTYRGVLSPEQARIIG